MFAERLVCSGPAFENVTPTYSQIFSEPLRRIVDIRRRLEASSSRYVLHDVFYDPKHTNPLPIEASDGPRFDIYLWFGLPLDLRKEDTLVRLIFLHPAGPLRTAFPQTPSIVRSCARTFSEFRYD